MFIHSDFYKMVVNSSHNIKPFCNYLIDISCKNFFFILMKFFKHLIKFLICSKTF